MFTSFAECQEDYVIQRTKGGGKRKDGKLQPSNKPMIMWRESYEALHSFKFELKFILV